MIEDSLELNSKTKSEIEKSLKNVKNGKVISHEDAKKRLGL
jgi:predicted transcriptional regulator